MKSFATAGLALAAVTALCASSAHAARASRPIPPPISFAASQYYRAHPEARPAQPVRMPHRGAALSTNGKHFLPPAGGAWSYMNGDPGGLCSPHLLHDGTVLAQVCNSQFWYKLAPDSSGSYANGTWTQIASLPVIGATQYAPLYYASQVLPDGRLLIEGGEYNGNGTEVWTNLGAIYNPNSNIWKAVAAPSGVTQIGDAQSVSLTSGKVMLGTCCDNPAKNFLFNPNTLAWTATGAPAGYQDEQGYELLPTGKILTINVWTPPGTQLYDPGAGTWSAGPTIPVVLPDTCGNFEIEPAVVRGNHTVVAFGGDTCGVNPDPTAILDTQTNTWSAGPTVPAVCGTGTTPCDLADAPSALMRNGKILFGASSGYGNAPTHFFEMALQSNAITQVADPLQDADGEGAYAVNFLVLPTGQIMVTDFNVAELYTPVGPSITAWAPVVSTAPGTISRGSTYSITGKQLNGRSAGAYYGDDWQAFTNFPLVRIVNNSTGQVVYANSTGFKNFSIAPNARGSFSFTVPPRTRTGAATLYVVANGIASSGVPITVH